MREIPIYEMVNCPMRGRNIPVGHCLAGCPYHQLGATLHSPAIRCTYDERED